MTRLDLPGGAWAELRDPEAVTERQRKPFIGALGRAAKAEGSEDGGLTAMIEVQDTLVMAMISSWSFELPIAADSLLDLPHKTVSALRTACTKFQAELLPDFGVDPDPASPTVPSSV